MENNLDRIGRKERKRLRKEKKRFKNKKNKLKIRSKKVKRLIKSTQTNIEHLIPKCRGGSNHKDNNKISIKKKHDNKHGYLGVRVFHEQILKILEDNYTTLNKTTGNYICMKIVQILDTAFNEGKLYDKNCYYGDKIKKNTYDND